MGKRDSTIAEEGVAEEGVCVWGEGDGGDIIEFQPRTIINQ